MQELQEMRGAPERIPVERRQFHGSKAKWIWIFCRNIFLVTGINHFLNSLYVQHSGGSRLFRPQTAIPATAAAAATCARKHTSAKSVHSRAPEKHYLHLAESRKHGKVSPLDGELVLFRRSSAGTCRRGLWLFREPWASGLFPPPGKTRPLCPSRTEKNNDGK